MYKCVRIHVFPVILTAALLTGAVLSLPLLCRDSAVAASSDANAEQSLPVIMYHSVLADPSRTGEYVITPDEFEKDLIYIKSKGMNTVTPDMIIDYTDNGTPLPDDPILLTFDDGHLNNMTYALPLLEKYDMYATVSVVGAYTLKAEEEHDPNPYYAYLTHDDITALDKEGHFDIGCHTYDMHSLSSRSGASRKSSETEEEYKASFSRDLSLFRDEISEKCGISPTVYAYPYGLISSEGYDLLKEYGYRIVLTCCERGNTVSCGTGDSLIILDRYNRSGLMQSDDFMKKAGL